ncbi:MAG: carbohydrate ABC transporter permease [Chloroflexi bacterium]|nr:carbohydrate ABC transporter permease [Chloroflexota bacterium]
MVKATMLATTYRPVRFRWRYVRIPVAAVLMVLYFSPIYWMFKTALQPEHEISLNAMNLFTPSFTLENFARVLSEPRFFGWVKNSLILAIATMVVAVLVSTLAGYSLARLRFWAVKFLGRPFLLAYIVPSVMIVVPVFVTFAGIGWQNTYHAIIITYTSFAVPFCTWLLRAYFLTLPTELEDAALIDGCSRLGALFRVIVPLAAPGMVTAGLFSFVLAWNEFLFAFVFVFSDDMRPLSVGLMATILEAVYGSSADLSIFKVGAMFALCVLAAIPVLLVFLFLQGWLVRGLAAGAVKG